MRHRAAVLSCVVLAVTACRKEAPPAAPAPNVMVINASDFSFAAPDTVPAGWTQVRLVSAGPSMHHAALMKIEGGKTFDTLMAMLRTPPAPNAPPMASPPWLKEIGSPNAPSPGDTSSVITQLEPGHYAILCFIPDSLGRPHFILGMSRPLEVTAASGPTAAEPVADMEIKLSDYTFTESAPIAAGHRTIRISNEGPQSHEVIIARLDSGTTARQLGDWVTGGMHGAPPAQPVGGTTGISIGGHAYVVGDFRPGHYALICFIPDSADGKDHMSHGMLKEITVD
jgi:hypothetical protein